MNLNKFLCSHFEPNEDGKVTIGHIADFAIKISIIAVVLFSFTVWIGGVLIHMCEFFGIISETDLPQYVLDEKIIGSIIFFFIAGLLLLLLIVVIVAVLLLAIYIIDRICLIEIASCHIKKEEDETEKEK